MLEVQKEGINRTGACVDKTAAQHAITLHGMAHPAATKVNLSLVTPWPLVQC